MTSEIEKRLLTIGALKKTTTKSTKKANARKTKESKKERW